MEEVEVASNGGNSCLTEYRTQAPHPHNNPFPLMTPPASQESQLLTVHCSKTSDKTAVSTTSKSIPALNSLYYLRGE